MTLAFPSQQNLVIFKDANLFNQMLQSDSVYRALDFRQQYLEHLARDIRSEMELSKSLAIGLSLTGCFIASPVAIAASGLGLMCYLLTLAKDVEISHKFCPLPFCRKPIFRLVESVGSAVNGDDEMDDEIDPLEDITSFLEPSQANEFEVLYFSAEDVSRLLSQIDPTRRIEAYRYVMNHARRTGELPGLQTLQTANCRDYQDVVEPKQIEAAKPQIQEAIDVPVTIIQDVQTPVQTQSTVAAVPRFLAIPNVKERMTALLKALSDEGFPIGSLLNHPFVWCWGRSQSGKTTAALMLAIARLSMGHKVGYYTTDDDYPRDLPWSQVESDVDAYQTGLEEVAQAIATASKGALKGQSWLFDEMLAASSHYELDLQPLLITVLMKGAKTGGGVIGISQADTSGAHGLKGIDLAWRNERVSIQAIHVENELGDRTPTGQYIVRRGDSTERWSIPKWMLTENNEYGQVDPIVWLLNHFPELKRGVSTQPGIMTVEMEAVYKWAKGKDSPVNARQVQQAKLAQLSGFGADAIRGIFTSLERLGYGKTNGLRDAMTYDPTA